MCISTRNCCRIIHRCYWTSVRSVLWKYWPSSSLWTEPQATSINLQNRTPYVLSDVTLQCIDQIQINRIPADIEKLLIKKEACWSALQLFSLSKFHSKTELCPTLKFRRTFITMLRVSMINIFIWFVISNCCCCLWLPWHLVALFREPGKTCWSYQLTLTYMIIRGPWMGNLLRSGNYIIVM